MTAGTDDCFAAAKQCFAAVANSFAAYYTEVGLDILGLSASDIEPKPFRPIVTDWPSHVHDHCGGAE